MITRRLSVALLGCCAAVAFAQTDRVEHFKGLPAETLEQAVENFSVYNGRLQEVLDKGTLTAEDLATVHELTYTLENALAKIDTELTTLAETLEEVHLASEAADIGRVETAGQAYLSGARVLIP
jgi:hypothetical protein